MTGAAATDWPEPIRVVGLGSAHGDDAVGWHAVAAARAALAAQPGVHLACIPTAADLLELLDGQGTLVVVDAVCSGAPPGRLHRLSWPEDRLQPTRHYSTHGMGLAEALPLAQALGLLPPRVEVWGVEIDPEAVHAHVAEAARRLAAWLVNVLDGRSEQPHVQDFAGAAGLDGQARSGHRSCRGTSQSQRRPDHPGSRD